jgi:hypothetical protein
MSNASNENDSPDRPTNKQRVADASSGARLGLWADHEQTGNNRGRLMGRQWEGMDTTRLMAVSRQQPHPTVAHEGTTGLYTPSSQPAKSKGIHRSIMTGVISFLIGHPDIDHSRIDGPVPKCPLHCCTFARLTSRRTMCVARVCFKTCG